MQAYSDPKRAEDPYALPDVEVFYVTASDFVNADEDTWLSDRLNDMEAGEDVEGLSGWYWWPCFPGCLPEGDPVGPFPTEQEALEDAQSLDYD